MAFGLPPVKPVPPRRKSHPFDFGSVLRNRAAMGYVFGYSSHTWELFGARSWMVAYLAWVLASQPGASGLSPTSIATIGSLLAMVASVVGAELAVRYGRRRLCVFAMLGSGALATAIGFCSGLAYGAVAALMLLYNALIQDDSAALTTGAVLAADSDRRGATLSVHSVLGFSAGFVGPLAFGIVLDAAGGANTGLAWGLAFASLGVAAALGPLALKIR